MRVTVLTSKAPHPVHTLLGAWARSVEGAQVEIVKEPALAAGGDILFLVSCNQIVGREILARYRHSLVLHASDLPLGRGWSPMIWAVLEGAKEIVVTLLEAEDKVDSGAIWAQRRIELQGHELCDELHALLFQAEFDLMDYAIRNEKKIVPSNQSAESPSYYKKRTPADSRLDPDKSIAEQFDLLRVCDNERYPAFFEHRGHRYEVQLKKVDQK